jgi:hypothetical protein
LAGCRFTDTGRDNDPQIIGSRMHVGVVRDVARQEPAERVGIGQAQLDTGVRAVFVVGREAVVPTDRPDGISPPGP